MPRCLFGACAPLRCDDRAALPTASYRPTMEWTHLRMAQDGRMRTLSSRAERGIQGRRTGICTTAGPWIPRFARDDSLCGSSCEDVVHTVVPAEAHTLARSVRRAGGIRARSRGIARAVSAIPAAR